MVVNENDEVIGTMPKADAHKNGAPHRISVVYVENPSGQILVQVRTDGRLDHSAAGHVDPGESYEQAARRELFEELGISGVTLAYVGHGMTTGEKSSTELRSHVFDIFTCIAEPRELQAEEVERVYWAAAEDVLRDMHGANTDSYCGGFKVSLPIYMGARKK